MRSTFILLLTFIFFQFTSPGQTSSNLLGTWKLVNYALYEHDVLVKEEKSDHKRNIYIHGDGTIGYAYVHYVGFFNHGVFPHTSKEPVLNWWTQTDSVLNIYKLPPKKTNKERVGEKTINKIIINKLVADTLVLIFTDGNARCYNTYNRVKEK